MSSACNPPILEFRNLSFSYDAAASFIDRLSFCVGEGEFIGLLGANGSGKSTILKLGSGILTPLSGEINLWGRNLRYYRNRDRAKLISYLPQMLDITVPFNVREIVSMGLYPYDIPPLMTADEALESVGLAEKADSPVADLSGGERRRTFIAMNLLQGAGLLMLDEPLANLDIRYQIELVNLLKRLKREKNISIVMALHDINIALQFEKVMIIREGRLLGLGSPDEVLTSPMIREAFGVDIEIRSDTEGLSVSYRRNF